MAISQQLKDRIEALAADLRKGLYGPKRGIRLGERNSWRSKIRPERWAMPWLARCSPRAFDSRPRRRAIRPTSAGGGGEPIPLKEIAGRLLQAKRGDAAWQESYGRCRRCRKAFFPQSQALGIAPDDTVSPRVLRKMVYAGSHASSFRQASEDLMSFEKQNG